MYLRHLLPGLAVAPAPPAAPDALPRMDVALFIGFAARGPVHRPVVIESPGAFAAVFGGELVLTPDCSAALGPAVRAFFANGGTRCHVVRTCRTAALEAAWQEHRPLGAAMPEGGIAEAGTYLLPGLTALQADNTSGPALIRGASLGSWSDHLLVAVRLERTAIALRGPEVSMLGLQLAAGTSLQPGELVELRGDGWRVFGIARAHGGGILVETNNAVPLPDMPERIDRMRLMLGASEGGNFTPLGPFGLTPAAPDSWWSVPDDDRYYADPEALVTPRSPLAAMGDVRPVAWLPTDLGENWTLLSGPLVSGATALERDGLSRFDAELFLDPRLTDSRGASLLTQAEFVREHDGGGLFGIHAALALPGGSDFAEPSLVAVPDLTQPGWISAPRPRLEPARPANVEAPPAWRNHTGPCVVTADGLLIEPDTSRFLDCGTRLLATPRFAVIKEELPGPIALSWSPSEAGANYILNESGRSDFTGAVEIWRGTDLQFRADAPRAGSYYYAIHAEHDGNVSATDVTGVVLAASEWESDVAHYNPVALIQVQQAMLRLCAVLGDQFAILSLPRHFDAQAAAMHRSQLVAGLSFNEAAALRFGALYHPWLVTGDGPAGALSQMPPDGAAAGVIARRARERGAWIGPARVPLADVLALADPIAPSDRERLATAGVNVIAQEPTGFLMTDAMTLSDESDWREINVRRLVSLLRRTATRRGATYVFEPNGDVLRRVIERTFGHLLDDLLRRGAFAGKGREDSYRLAIDPTQGDRMNGRLVIELAIAPSRPLRFLRIVLNQVGERLVVVEER